MISVDEKCLLIYSIHATFVPFSEDCLIIGRKSLISSPPFHDEKTSESAELPLRRDHHEQKRSGRCKKIVQISWLSWFKGCHFKYTLHPTGSHPGEPGEAVRGDWVVCNVGGQAAADRGLHEEDVHWSDKGKTVSNSARHSAWTRGKWIFHSWVPKINASKHLRLW